jgi:hypothetical protein
MDELIYLLPVLGGLTLLVGPPAEQDEGEDDDQCAHWGHLRFPSFAIRAHSYIPGHRPNVRNGVESKRGCG